MTALDSHNGGKLFDGVPGPAPWFLRPGTPTAVGFRWEQTAKGKSILVGSGGITAVADFYVWVQMLNSTTLLAWYQARREQNQPTKPVILTVFKPALMMPFTAELKLVEDEMKKTGCPLVLSSEPVARLELPTTRINEDLTTDYPKEIRHIEELLILCDSSGIDDRDGTNMDLALLIAKPGLGTFRLYPQDWFNSADLDFGYQWVTRMARDPVTGRVRGEGIRLAPFELDDSLCQLARHPLT